MLYPLISAGLLLASALAAKPSRAPAPLPAAARRVKLVIDEVDGLGLLRADRLGPQRVVAAWASKRGFTVVPLEQSEAILADARGGKKPRTTEACGRALSRLDALSRYAALLGDGVLHSTVLCEAGACKLVVTAERGFGFGDDELFSEQASYDPKRPWSTELPRALSALHVVPDDQGGGLGMMGGLEGSPATPHPERLDLKVTPARADDTRDSDSLEGALTFAGGLGPLRACFGSADAQVELEVQTTAAGAVRQCEARDVDTPAALCACAAVTQHAHVAVPLQNLAAYLTVTFNPADVVIGGTWVTSSVRQTRETYPAPNGDPLYRAVVSDPSIVEWTPPNDREVTACLTGLRAPQRANVQVTVHFDARGAATAADVVAGAKTHFTSAQLECVRRAFLSSTAPCPAVPTSTAEAVVDIVAQAVK